MQGAFDDLIPQQQTQAAPPAATQGGANAFSDLVPQKASMGSGMAFVNAFDAGAANLPRGILKLVSNEKWTNAFNQVAKDDAADLKAAQQAHPIAAGLGNFAGGVASSAPLWAIPGLGQGKWLKPISQAFMQNTAYGALTDPGQNGSRLANAAIGGGLGLAGVPVLGGLLSNNPITRSLVGGAIGAGIGGYYGGAEGAAVGGGIGAGVPHIPALAVQGTKAGVNKLAQKIGITGQDAPIFQPTPGPIKKVAQQKMLEGLDDNAIAVKQAGNRVGLNLRPAEASGSPITGTAEGNVGTSKAGAAKMYQAQSQSLGDQKASIDNVLSSVSENPAPAADRIQSAAQSAIADKQKALRATARPLYANAESQAIPMEAHNQLIQDPLIGDAYKYVIKSPIYGRELGQGQYPENSIKVWDQVKKRLDDMASTAGYGTNESRIITNAKNDLTSQLDEASPVYQQARQTFGEGAAPLEQLKNSPVGKIANLNDIDVKKIPGIVFDPGQTDAKVLGQIRDEIYAKDPEAWNSLVRNHMEQKIRAVTDEAGESVDESGIKTAPNFYKKVLSDDQQFNQYMTALKNNPIAQQKLRDARLAYKNVINPMNARGAARIAQQNLGDFRNPFSAAAGIAKNFIGGKLDNASVDFITNPQWDKAYTALRGQVGNQRAINIAKLISKIGTVGATQLTNQP